MGHSAVHEYLQTLRRWYKVKRREAPPSQPTCSSGALRSVGCFGCANSRLSSVIAQKQMCAKYRTLPSALRRICREIIENTEGNAKTVDSLRRCKWTNSTSKSAPKTKKPTRGPVGGESKKWSGRRGSNPRLSAPKADALATALRPGWRIA